MKSFIGSVIAVSFFSMICSMIAPPGSMRKYLKLVLGFIMMSILISPIDNTSINLNFDEYISIGMSEEEINAQSDAYILEIHKKNIEKRVREITGSDTDVFVELHTDGRVKSVSLRGENAENHILQLQEELGCENIKIIEG